MPFFGYVAPRDEQTLSPVIARLLIFGKMSTRSLYSLSFLLIIYTHKVNTSCAPFSSLSSSLSVLSALGQSRPPMLGVVAGLGRALPMLTTRYLYLRAESITHKEEHERVRPDVLFMRYKNKRTYESTVVRTRKNKRVYHR